MAGKSLMDLHLFLDDLSDEILDRRLEERKTNVDTPYLSIEVMIDKTWRILEHTPGEPLATTLLSSEDMDDRYHNIDIYDLLNMHPGSIAERIMQDASVRNIKLEEL